MKFQVIRYNKPIPLKQMATMADFVGPTVFCCRRIKIYYLSTVFTDVGRTIFEFVEYLTKSRRFNDDRLYCPPPPSHNVLDSNWSKKGDSAGYFPTYESAKSYAEVVQNTPYHKDRLRAFNYLLKPMKGLDYSKSQAYNELAILDYGIGDGGLIAELNIPAKKIIGIDTSPHMLSLAKKNLDSYDFMGFCGSVETIKSIDSCSIDLALCLM